MTKVTCPPEVSEAFARAAMFILRVHASYACENQNDEWYDCPSGTAKYEECSDVSWCRSCEARAALGVEM